MQMQGPAGGDIPLVLVRLTEPPESRISSFCVCARVPLYINRLCELLAHSTPPARISSLASCVLVSPFGV